jgi:hypothetical protein
MSLIDDYEWAHGARIELLDGKLVAGKSLERSRLLLHQILRGWGIEAAIDLAPESMWWAALSVAFAPDLELAALTPQSLQTWAEGIEFQPHIPPAIETWSWRRSNLQQNMRMALHGLAQRFQLGYASGGGVVNRLGQNGLMPECYFFRGTKLQRLYEYYLDGAADLVVEFIAPGFAAYDRIDKRTLYQAAGVAEYWLIDADREEIELYRLINGVYERQFPDEGGRYQVSSIPGLTFLPNRLWQTKDERQFPPEDDLFEVAVDAPTITKIQDCGDGIDWRRDRVFSIALAPTEIAFADYIYWCPEAKFEFGEGRPEIGGREGIRGLIGMLLMTLGLQEAVRLFHPQQWVAALLKAREQDRNNDRWRAEWHEIARRAADLVRARTTVSRVAIAGDLATAAPLNFWSELVLVVCDLRLSPKDRWDLEREIGELSNDFEIRLIEPDDSISEIDRPLLGSPLLDI